MTTTVANRRSLGSTTVVLVALTVAAWIATIAWIRADDMSAMPGTMGINIAPFIAMWGLMMAAMMLPSVAPFIAVYRRTVTDHRPARLAALGFGYLAVWTGVGLVAYLIADRFGSLAVDRPTAAQWVAVGCFATVGVYQLTPLKFRCLRHCRSPLGHLVHYLSYRGQLRDVRAGASHGWFCIGCCWALMLLVVAFGVMNIAAMMALAAIIAVEKLWSHGETFARIVGVGCLAFAVALVFEPGLAPGLDPDAVMPVTAM